MAKEILIPNWKKAWKLHTVKLGVMLAALPQLLWGIIEVIGTSIPAVPDEVKEYLPPEVRTALSVVGLIVVIVRLWRQNNVAHFNHYDS